MQTRSRSRALSIDFDEASRAWMQNKKRVGQTYVYICGKSLKNGKTCQITQVDGKETCKRHSSREPTVLLAPLRPLPFSF